MRKSISNFKALNEKELGAVNGGICEELIIRGNFFSYALAERFDQPRYQLVTVIVNGVLFGLLRGGFSWGQLSYYTVMGLVLAATYILSGRDIRVNSVVHVTANLSLMLMA
ncbi:CPBP family intramembrane glutamic endopeptidase [Lactiplantibacillus argentoratensis]|uniref:CPBP family intramembrane glutamic endopeptidase n=1 Tax=Lactiplantibacillus argentoratensis TaxID=271881 RepID=UPI0030D0AE69